MSTRIILTHILILFIVTPNLGGQERISRFVPGPYPDRIILTISDDPSISMAVTWRTDTSVTESVAQIAPDLPSPYLADTAVTIKGSYSDVYGDGIVSRYHCISFSGLTPETSYAYRVGGAGTWSEWFRFTTASDTAKPFSFIYFGDSQVWDGSLFARIIRQAFKNTPQAAFMVYAGDLVDGGFSESLQDEEWGDWHNAGSFINGMVPTLAIPGNHEYFTPGDLYRRELNRYWKPGFAFPENGPEGLSETTYYVDYQGVRIIGLNSDEMMRNEASARVQAAWLEEVLKSNSHRWTVVVMHHPFFATLNNRDNKRVRDYLRPVVEKYNVDLVLSGHDHTYARAMVPPVGKTKNYNKASTVYIVSVSGAKQYPQDAVQWWDRGAVGGQFFQVITVDGGNLTYKCFTASGDLFDVFYLRKKPNGSKRMVVPFPEK